MKITLFSEVPVRSICYVEDSNIGYKYNVYLSKTSDVLSMRIKML